MLEITCRSLDETVTHAVEIITRFFYHEDVTSVQGYFYCGLYASSFMSRLALFKKPLLLIISESKITGDLTVKLPLDEIALV